MTTQERAVDVARLKASREANMREFIMNLFNRDRRSDEHVRSLAQVSDAQLRQIAQKEFGRGSGPASTQPEIAHEFQDLIYRMLGQRSAARRHAGNLMQGLDPDEVEGELNNIAEQLAPSTPPRSDPDDEYPF